MLIVCGYGFRDKGINRKIVDWAYSGDQHRLLIIHPEPDKLVLSARGAISKNWDDLKINNRLSVIQKKIEDVNWSDVSDYLQ